MEKKNMLKISVAVILVAFIVFSVFSYKKVQEFVSDVSKGMSASIMESASNKTRITAAAVRNETETAQEEWYSKPDIGLDEIQYMIKGVDFIVGNKAPSADIVTISEIKSRLFEKDIETGTAKLADEVDDYRSKSYVVIGSPCDNPVAAELLKKEIAKKGECNIFKEGAAWIRLFKTSSGSYLLYIGGGNPEDTRLAGKVVGNYDKYSLYGDKLEVSGPADKPTVNLLI